MISINKRNKNLKLVAYECGNKFIMDMEAILFKDDEDTVIHDKVKARSSMVYSTNGKNKLRLL